MDSSVRHGKPKASNPFELCIIFFQNNIYISLSTQVRVFSENLKLKFFEQIASGEYVS